MWVNFVALGLKEFFRVTCGFLLVGVVMGISGRDGHRGPVEEVLYSEVGMLHGFLSEMGWRWEKLPDGG